TTGQLTLTGAVSGSGELIKDGAGELVLGGTSTNTYTGLTFIQVGSVRIQKNSALGSAATGTLVSAGATLKLEASLNISGEGLALNSTAGSTTDALRNLSGDNRWLGSVDLITDTRIGVDADSLQLGVITTPGATPTGFVKDGPGTLILQSVNTYTGTTTI